MIAARMKHGVLIVIDIPFNHIHLDPVTLTCIFTKVILSGAGAISTFTQFMYITKIIFVENYNRFHSSLLFEHLCFTQENHVF